MSALVWTIRPTCSGQRWFAWYLMSSSSRSVERLDDGLSHLARAHSAAAILRDVGGAQALVEHRGDGALDAVGNVAKIEGIAQAHSEARDGGDGVGDAFAGDIRCRAVHRLVQSAAVALLVG